MKIIIIVQGVASDGGPNQYQESAKEYHSAVWRRRLILWRTAQPEQEQCRSTSSCEEGTSFTLHFQKVRLVLSRTPRHSFVQHVLVAQGPRKKTGMFLHNFARYICFRDPKSTNERGSNPKRKTAWQNSVSSHDKGTVRSSKASGCGSSKFSIPLEDWRDKWEGHRISSPQTWVRRNPMNTSMCRVYLTTKPSQ